MQDIIPYNKIYEDGICRIGAKNYTRTYEFTDINYAIADNGTKENMQLNYASILSSLDPRANWKITFMTVRRSQKEIEENMLIPQKDDDFQDYRDELNEIMLDKIAVSSPFIVRRFLTCSIIKDSYEEAKDFFERISSELYTMFFTLGSGSSCVPLNEVERLKVFHDFYRPNELEHFSYDGSQRKKWGDSTKNYIAPYSFSAQFDHVKIDNVYGQGLMLLEYPNGLDDDFFRSLVELKIQFVYSMDLIPVSKDEARKYIESKKMAVESEILKYQQRQNKNQNFSAEIPFDRKQERADLESIFNQINNEDQHLFFCTCSIFHTADSKRTLDSNCDKLIAAAQSKNLEFAVAKIKTRQLKTMNTALPYGVSLMDYDLRPLTSGDIAAFVPFISEECCHTKGIYCGTNTISGNVIKVDRRELMNGNCWILAVSGGGKSMTIKSQIMTLRLMPDDNSDVIIIDPEREYVAITQALNGNVAKLSPSSTTHINPFDINAEYGKDDEGTGDPVKEKSSFILSMCEQILVDEGISLLEKSLIDRAVRLLYEPLKAIHYEGEMPTFKDFCKVLKSMEEPEAHELAGKFEIYAYGSLDYFSQQTNVDTSSSMLCYDINEMGSQLQHLGLLIVLDNILNRISRNRYKGRYTYVIIDEIYLLFEHKYSTEFLEKLWKRIRKYNGYATGIIQNVTAVTRNPKARDMLSNSAFTIMLSQSEEDAAELSKIYNISKEEQRFIKQNMPGKGLIHLGTTTTVPFDNIIPKDTKIYGLMTTKPGEVENYGQS